MDTKIIDFENYEIDSMHVLEQFDDNERDMYEMILDELLEDAHDIAKPIGIIKKLPVKILGPSEVELGDESFYSSYLAECLDDVEEVYGFAVSIGKSLWNYRVNMTDALEQLIFDAVMKTCLDDVFAKVAAEIVSYLPDKTNYYMDNPGHLDGWDIADQHKLVAMLADVAQEADDDSLTINGEYLFENSFSMSGIIYNKGIASSNCAFCPKENCEHRRADFSSAALITRLYESSGRFEN